MRKYLAFVGLALVLSLGCKTVSTARHGATVTVVGAHSTLSFVQDTELKLECGKAGAPPEGACVPLDAHRQIHAKLAQAFALDAQLARTVQAIPTDSPTPPEVINLVQQITTLVREVMALIPDSPQKKNMESQVSRDLRLDLERRDQKLVGYPWDSGCGPKCPAPRT